MCQISDTFCHEKSDGSKEYRVFLFYASKSTVFSYSVDSKGKMHKLVASIACKIRETIKVSAPTKTKWIGSLAICTFSNRTCQIHKFIFVLGK
jgi:hypothetical protein